jgi:hypothetical protein
MASSLPELTSIFVNAPLMQQINGRYYRFGHNEIDAEQCGFRDAK